MTTQFPISINQVVDFLSLEREPRFRSGATSYNVRCPFCGDRKYHMNINTQKNTYYCFHCSGGKAGGGALDLFSRAFLGCELVPGKTQNGGNGGYIYAKLLEALGLPSHSYQRPAVRHSVPKPEPLKRASDSRLHKAYSAVLDFTGFALTGEHRGKLLQRGIREAAIERNGYRSVGGFQWLKECPEASERYRRFRLDRKCGEFEFLRRQPAELRIAGIAVAEHLRKADIDMEGVPGFFRFSVTEDGQKKDIWSFRLETGMLIPTRNRNGEIVCLQARKDRGRLRYMTLSSKGLPGGVSSGISRTHFPKGNAALSANTRVYLTEGPLKADISCDLIGEDSFFIALQGVNNTSELPAVFKEIHDAGITQIFNAMDMDKLTNPHVAAAARAIQEMAGGLGLEMPMMLWDKSHACARYLELAALCRYYGLPVDPAQDSIFLALEAMTDTLHQANIQHSIRFDRSGKEVKEYWKSSSKGIDDYLAAVSSCKG